MINVKNPIRKQGKKPWLEQRNHLLLDIVYSIEKTTLSWVQKAHLFFFSHYSLLLFWCLTSSFGEKKYLLRRAHEIHVSLTCGTHMPVKHGSHEPTSYKIFPFGESQSFSFYRPSEVQILPQVLNAYGYYYITKLGTTFFGSCATLFFVGKLSNGAWYSVGNYQGFQTP